MNSLDIILLQKDKYQNFELDVKSAQRLVNEGKIEKAGDKYKDIARNLLKLNLYVFSIDYYRLASENFIDVERYEKSINTYETIYNIYRLMNDQNGMAKAKNIIASYYKFYLKQFNQAGNNYLKSGLHHEANQNYKSSFKKYDSACKAFEAANDINKENIKKAHSMAFRAALQAGFYEKAGLHAKLWFELMPKDYSAHFISVCQKGYKTFLNTSLSAEALMFAKEIIISHYEKNVPQRKIINVLLNVQKLTILSTNLVDVSVHRAIEEEYFSEPFKIVNYCTEMRSLCENNGLVNLSDFFYVEEKNALKQIYKKVNRINYLKYKIWELSSMYGTSFNRWVVSSFLIIVFFGFLYSDFPAPNFISHDIIQGINKLSCIKPEVKISSVKNLFSPFYYSVVTLATLGYGDIVPSNLAGQIASVIEVLLGYIMLGGLLSIFSKKITR